MEDDLEAVFRQYHVQSGRNPELKTYDLFQRIDERAEEYTQLHKTLNIIGSAGSVRHDFSQPKVETECQSYRFRDRLMSEERERRLDAVLRAKKEREDEIQAAEILREQKAEDQRRAEKARWDKVVNRLKVHPLNSTYYASTPFKPGFFFLDSLINAPKARFKDLRLNIPDTLYFTTELMYVGTGKRYSDPMGFVSCKEDISALDFLKIIEKGVKRNSTHPFDGVAVVMRGRGSSEHEILKHLLDWSTFRQKVASLDLSQFSMFQRFIKSPGGKAAAIRLCYHPSTRDNKANTAFFLSSTNLKMTCTTPAELMQRCVINLDFVNGFEIFKMSGPAIKEVESHAEALVHYLNRGYGVRVDQIDLDFLKDEQGKLWFCGCQGFRLDPASFVPYQVINEKKDEEKEKKELKERMQAMEERKKGSFVRCKLCRLNYPNYELKHLIAIRMLVVFKMHSSKRQDLPVDTDHIKVVVPDILSQSVRVCDLCFMLITSEFQLIQAEKDLAAAMNIPYKEEGLEEDERHLMQLQFLPKQLMQWRSLVYFRYIQNHELLFSYSELRLELVLNDVKTVFHVKKDIFLQGNSTISVNKLKMSYMFSDPSKPIREFLANSKAKISLYDATNPSALIAQSEFHVFSDFPRAVSPGSALVQKKMVSLFPPACTSSFEFALTLGLSCDHLHNSRYIKTTLEKVFEVYLPEGHYCNGDELPTPWMEMFQEVKMEQSFREEVSQMQTYSCTLAPEELRRMEDITSPYTKRNLTSTHPKSRPALRPSSAIVSNPTVSVPHLDLSELDSRTQASIKEVFVTVRNFLKDRPKSAVSPPETETVRFQDSSTGTRSKGVSMDIKTTSRIQSAKGKRVKPSSKGTSFNSSRITSPMSTQMTFSEHFKEISRCVSQDMRNFGLETSMRRIKTNPGPFRKAKEVEEITEV